MSLRTLKPQYSARNRIYFYLRSKNLLVEEDKKEEPKKIQKTTPFCREDEYVSER